MTDFEKELAILISKHSEENESDTPDFILADYLKMCLAAFAKITKKNDAWYSNFHHLAQINAAYHMGCVAEAVMHTGKPVAHIAGEIIVSMNPETAVCNGKCKYSPGLIRLDEIKIHSEDGLLLGVSDAEGNITDATEDQMGVTGRIDSNGNYSIDFVAFSDLASLTAKITYDYEYDLPVEEKNNG